MKNLFIPFACLLFAACTSKPADKATASNTPAKDSLRTDFKTFYDDAKVEGAFVLYNVNTNQYLYYNKADAETRYTPASTFKIPNTLIGLETGVITDANHTLKWDGVKRRIDAWNLDTDLRMAFKNSTVWYYQAVARGVGGQRMQYWLNKLTYGNRDTTGGIDQFWLNASLRISPKEEVDFITQLYNNQLPVAKRNIDILKDIMIAKDTVNFKLRAKTGWGFQNKQDIGWYVGYLEANNNAYIFANLIHSADSTNPDFGPARIAICYNIFKTLGLYKGQ